tara:strand:+ start:5181 stop:6032 length:852 start_codon:yes stop_codon:yes gene_type:complete
LERISICGGILCFLILPFAGVSYSEDANINIDQSLYKKSDIISIWGFVPNSPQNLVFVTIKDSNENIVWTEKINVDENGNFTTLIIAGTHGWMSSGTYEILLESGEIIDSVSFFYDSGIQVNPPSAIDEFYVSQEDLILTFVIASVIVIGIFVYLARNIILRKKTKYDELDLESKRNRDYEKYHSEWSEEKVFSGREESTINKKEFNEMLKSKTLPNYYKIIGVTENASPIEIKQQFRKLAKEWHPDKRKDGSEDKMSEINRAYEVLSNKELRDEYDKYYKLL